MKKFSVVSVKQNKVKPPFENIVVASKTPNGAARKAFNKFFRLHDVRTGVITIENKETGKQYKYKITRKRINKKVERDGKEIVYRFMTQVKKFV